MTAFYSDLLTLCSKIESAWQKCNFDSSRFYEVVWDLTEKVDLTPLGEISNQMKLLDHPMVRLCQQRSTFSDLYFLAFNNGRFMIEVLNWAGAHVNVHDHDFSAVQFQLKGNSLNVVYDFDSYGETQGALQLGRLNVRKAEIWREGGRSVVRSGNIDPHSVFHIGQPTTSLLIRTLPTQRLGAQSNYFPTLKAHYAVNTDIQRKKLTGLGLMMRHEPRQFTAHLEAFLNEQSHSENFFMLLKFGRELFTARYLDLLSQYADRGFTEAKIVESVAYNNGIDFMKARANEYAADNDEQKLALFAIAATHGAENLARLESCLRDEGVRLNLESHLQSFRSKLSVSDRALFENYLELFSDVEAVGA